MDAFPAVCYDPNAPADAKTGNPGGGAGLCSGWYGPENLEVVDTVRVPATLTAGEYVVQWRWVGAFWHSRTCPPWLAD